MAALRVAIVGAGIAGLTCAQALAEAGLAPVILDKSRGVGGRMATRRADAGLQFDHGTPYLAATDAGFAAVLAKAEAEGALSRWRPPAREAEDAGPGYVGLPGMSGFARHLARGLDIRLGVTVTSVAPDGAGWRVTAADRSDVYDHLVLTLPAPQILRLLTPDNPLAADLAADLSAVRMSPCLTLMAAFSPQSDTDPKTDFATDLAAVTLETSKPGRDGSLQSWVAHATADFSLRHLERDLPEVAGLMLPLLCAAIGRSPAEAVHSVAHRWRYALVDRALGRPFLVDPSNRLYLGGDWCIGKTVQDGWSSGRAIAGDLLARLGHAPPGHLYTVS